MSSLSVGNTVVKLLMRSSGRNVRLSFEQIADEAGIQGVSAFEFDWTDDMHPDVGRWLDAGWEADGKPENEVVSFSKRDRQAFFVRNDI